MEENMENVFIMDHPLIQHKISMLRNKNTGTNEFRKLIEEIAVLMGYEALRDLPLEDVEIETPRRSDEGMQQSEESHRHHTAQEGERNQRHPKVIDAEVIALSLVNLNDTEAGICIGEVVREYRPVHPFDYACRPRLRTRLTQGR